MTVLQRGYGISITAVTRVGTKVVRLAEQMQRTFAFSFEHGGKRVQ